jgi:hypothetical protein
MGEGVAVMRQWPGESELWALAVRYVYRVLEILSVRVQAPKTSPPNPHDTPPLALFLLYTERWLLKLQTAEPAAVTLPSRCAAMLSYENID